MANKNIITTYALINQVEQTYYAPIALLPEPLNYPLVALYGFLGRVDPWQDDTDPVTPTQDQKYLKQVFKNMFAVKKVSPMSANVVTYKAALAYVFIRVVLRLFARRLHECRSGGQYLRFVSAATAALLP